MEVIVPVKKILEELDYRTDRLNDKSRKYVGKIEIKMSKWNIYLALQMRSQMSDTSDLITIVPFLQDFTLDCDSNDKHEGVTMWTYNTFMNNSASSMLYARICHRCPKFMTKKGLLISHC